MQHVKNMFTTSSAKYQVQTSLLPTLGSFHAVSHFAPWVVASLPKLADNLPVTRCLGHPRGEPMISGVTRNNSKYNSQCIYNMLQGICPSMFLSLHPNLGCEVTDTACHGTVSQLLLQLLCKVRPWLGARMERGRVGGDLWMSRAVVKIRSLRKAGTQKMQHLQLKHPLFPFFGLISRKDWTRSVSHLVNKVADVFPQVWWKKCSSTCWGRFWTQQTGTFRASTSHNATLQCFNIWSKTLGIVGFTRELDGILFCLLFGRQFLQQQFIQHETCWKLFSATF